jgi:hypothetical protein
VVRDLCKSEAKLDFARIETTSPPTRRAFLRLSGNALRETDMRTLTPFNSNDEIAAIARGLADRTLPKPAWTHAAHFASALWLLASCPEIDCLNAMPGMIRAYNEATGVANTDTSGYHETITIASLRAARKFLAEDPSRPLFKTCNALLTSPCGESNWLLAYWSRPRLFSVEARRVWVDPDLEAFPF